MVIFELDTKETQKIFKEIKKFLTAAKSWKITTTIELTVIDGLVQVVGSGFIRETKALPTESCKLVVPVIHWYELFHITSTPMVKQSRITILEEERKCWEKYLPHSSKLN